MIDLIKNYLDNIFSNLPETQEVLDAKQELFLNMEEKFIELKDEGKSDADAFAIVISEFGNVEEILDDMGQTKEESKAEKTINKEDSIFFEAEKKIENEIESAFSKADKAHDNANKLSKVLWGIFLIVLALSGLLSLIFNGDFDFFFDGWWTMFLIIPGIIGIATKEEKQWSFILLIIGVVLLVQSMSDYDFDWMWPAVIILGLLTIGIKMLFFNNLAFNHEANEYGKSIDISDEIVAIFGGSTLDLSTTKFTSDVRIKCTAIFGGIDIIVPSDVDVVAKGHSIFGGVDSKRNPFNSKYTVYVDYICAFGGIDIE